MEYDIAFDTYHMVFEAVSVNRATFDAKRRFATRIEDVHCGELCQVFTQVTGLHTEMVRFAM